MRILPYLIAALQAGASLVYLIKGEWRLAIIWIGVGVANMALAGIR